MDCNPLLYRTSETCRVTDKYNELYVMPCMGTCLDAMVINVELTPRHPGNSGPREKPEGDDSAVIRIVMREREFNQKVHLLTDKN